MMSVSDRSRRMFKQGHHLSYLHYTDRFPWQMEAGIQQESERENESSIPTIYKKKRKLFYLDFLLTPSYTKNITQVIDITGILEDNFFVLSSRLKNHPPSYAASHLPWWGFGREPGGTWEQAGQRGSALSPQSWPALFATLLWGLLNISSTLNTLIIRLHTSLPHWALWCY